MNPCSEMFLPLLPSFCQQSLGIHRDLPGALAVLLLLQAAFGVKDFAPTSLVVREVWLFSQTQSHGVVWVGRLVDTFKGRLTQPLCFGLFGVLLFPSSSQEGSHESGSESGKEGMIGCSGAGTAK